MYNDANFWTILADTNPEFYAVHWAEHQARRDRDARDALELVTLEQSDLMEVQYDLTYARDCMPNFAIVNGPTTGVSKVSGFKFVFQGSYGFQNSAIYGHSLIDEVSMKSEHYIELANFILEQECFAIAGGFVDGYVNGHVLWNDIDVFFIGTSDFETAILQFIERVGEDRLANIILSPNAISMEISYNDDLIKIQFIKRVYADLKEILLGFDIDSCACAMVRDDNNMKIKCIGRYQLALKYRVNLMNPELNSTTMGIRLGKYTRRGYGCYPVGGYAMLAEAKGISNPVLFLARSDYVFTEKYTIMNIACDSSRSDRSIKRTIYKEDYGGNTRVVYLQGYYPKPALWRLIDKFAHNYSFRSKSGSVRFPDIGSMLKKVGAFVGIRITDPGTQVVGSFNPRDHEFYG